MSSVSKNEIVEAVRRGLVVWPGHPETSIPPDDSFTGYDEAGHQGPKHAVAADQIREALLELARGETAWDPRGLRLRDVTITGTLDLNWFELPFPVGFEGCEFDEWVWADHLQLPQLVFDSCRLDSFGGTGIQVAGRLLFFDCVGVTQVFLPDSRIGTFELRSESFDDPSKVRLVLEGAHFDELAFDYHAVLHGGVELFTGLAEIVSSRAFTAVEVDRVVVSDQPTGGESPVNGVRDWLWGGTTTTAATYLAAWLAEEDSVAPKRPHVLERARLWWTRGGQRQNRVFVPRTWQRFADALDGAGLGDEARELRIEAERHRTRVQSGRLRQFMSLVFFDLPTRYGYRNGRVGWILLSLYLLAASIVYFNRSAFVPTTELAGDGRYPGLWPFAYALDVVVSPVSTGQADGWWTGSSSGVAAALIIIKLLSWLLGAVFLAGISKVLNRSSS